MQIPSNRLRIVLAFLLANSICLTHAAAGEPVVTVTPEKPTWEQPLHVTYNTTADGARFQSDKELRMIVWTVYADGWHQFEAHSMHRVGNTFVGDIPLKKPLCQIRVHFSNQFDIHDSENNVPHQLIYRPDGQPVRHATASEIDDADATKARELFDKEMSLYPDNYYAYYEWWGSVKRHNRSQHESELISDLQRIEQSASGEPPDYQFVRVAAYLDLHKEAKARKILLAMLQKYPQARFTYFASRLYRYKTYAQNITGVGPKTVFAAIAETVRKHPASPLARLGIHEHLFDENFPTNAIRLIANAWIRDAPFHSLPYYALAFAAKREGHMEESYHAIRKAIDLTLTGNQNYPEGVEASHQIHRLPKMYRMWAETALALNKYAEALAASTTAASLSRNEGWGRAEELEGKVWSALHETYFAERAFVAANLRNTKRGMDDLRQLYIRSHGSQKGFDAHLGELLSEALKGKLFPAPDFDITTMHGDSFSSRKLRGKVVVLNFWYIGCGPCRAELPDLNRVVEAFKDQQDVLFLALATDSQDDLTVFLKKHPFSYHVVPEAKALHDLFDAFAHPTHVIIDRQGRVLWRTSGSMAFDELKPMIDRALSLTVE